MIIKYGTSESATIVDTKNIPSWLSYETITVATGTDDLEPSPDQEDSAEEE